ncbi:uncharacterized protein EAF02_006962 [Botrytis sinoallii]|uniref:uncharacterized protein n=1 Tax=Botrytis sinoallii TaxID=1463999 RepID=UPI0019005005|nr:uncharacterized protein EAF02_006962 [Botrytis sinoallii]KAF7881071.1 hypothetical protein EAF02_006962 [Botrytis sinoallii]
MDTSSQNESQRQDIVSPGYLMASPVEDRGSIESTGCGMATAAIPDHQVMTNDKVKPVSTQNKFQTNFTSVIPVNLVSPDSGCNTNNDTPFSGKEKFEAAYYSSEMFNFFEIKLYRNDLLSTIDAPASADSFVLFSLLPIESQRKIWFHVLPPPDSNVWALCQVRYWDNCSKAAVSIENDLSSISLTAFTFLYALQYVCRTAREIFLKHYSHFKFDGINKKIRDPEDEDDDNYRKPTVIAKSGGIWFDMEVDTLNLSNIYMLSKHTNVDGFSLILTALRSLTIDMIDIIDMPWLSVAERHMDIFWTGLESQCPALERLNIVLNNIRRFPRLQHLTELPPNIDFRILTKCIFLGVARPYHGLIMNPHNIEQLRNGQWVNPRIHSDKIEGDIQMSRELWETHSSKVEQANMDYWKKIDLRPVWMVYITSFYADHVRRGVIPGPFMAVQTSGNPTLFVRCNEDGSLLGEYDYFKQLFDEEDENIMEPLEEEPFEEERLIVIGDD